MNSDRLHRLYVSACYWMTAIIVALLFVENFVFSADFSLLGFREVDDVAFQVTLRKAHQTIHEGHLGKLFSLNDYAYGWVFWAPLVIATYPLFLISQWFAVDWPLIVFPRQVSLLFTVMSLVVMRRTLKQLAVPEWGCASGVLMLALLPTTGYFSMRFGTVNAVAFFSLLTVYLAIRQEPDIKRQVMQTSLSLAIAGGIKLSGLLIAPLVFLLVLRRVKGHPLLPTLLKPGLVFLSALAFLTNPQFLQLPFKWKVWTQYWATLNQILEGTRIQTGPDALWDRLIQGVFGSSGVALVMAILVAGWCMVVARDKDRRVDFLSIIFAAGLAMVYLMVSVKNHLSAGSYFTSVAFLMVLGVTGFAQHPKGIYLCAVLIGLLMFDVGERAAIGRNSLSEPWNHLSYFNSAARSHKDLAMAKQVEACLHEKAAGASVGHIFIDSSAPSVINPLSHPGTCVSIAWNNLSATGRYCDRPVDFMILDAHGAVGALPQARFDQMVQSSDPKVAAGYLRDRESRSELAASGMFGGQRFRMACDLGRIKVHQAQ